MPEKYIINPYTGKQDATGNTDDYLKIDQTTPQTIINGTPQFNNGITIKKDKFVYLDG